MSFLNQKVNAVIDAIDRSQARIVFGLDGRILDANTNFLSLFGYALSEIQGSITES